MQTKLSVSSLELCSHCGNPIELVRIQSKIDGLDKYFCCEGCETVYSLVHSISADNYYKLRGSQTVERVSREEHEDFDIDSFDSPAVFEKYVTLQNGIAEVYIRITNIHCAACVWLNEKVLSEAKGVLSAKINFASGRAKVSFEPSTIKLSSIIRLIRNIGYKAQLYAPGQKTQTQKKSLQTLFMRIGIAGFAFGNMMILSVALYSGYFSGIDTNFKRLFHYASWFFATPAYLYSGYPFMRGFFQSIKQKTLTMDFLLFLGISLAYFYSVFVTLTDRGEVYFDSVAMIYFFILIGKYFEEKARFKASEEIESLLCKLPESAILVVEGVETQVESNRIKQNDRIKILPGMRVPVDGIIETNLVLVDESFLTGESKPIEKQKGDKLLAGSLALDFPIELIASSDYHASTLSNLKVRLEEALLTKPKIQVLTEKIASYFISIVFIIALLTCAVWLIRTNFDIERALVYTISVLIVACPCALGISVPTALVMNHIVNSEHGVLLKNPSVIEPLSQIDIIFLDKTGTLTEGKFQVKSNTISDLYLPVVYHLERELNHPLAKSIVRYLKPLVESSPSTSQIEKKSFQAIPGQGIKAIVSLGAEDWIVLLGNHRLMDINEIPWPRESTEEGTSVHLAINGIYKGQMSLSDSIRPGAQNLVTSLQSRISQIVLLSGDGDSAVAATAEELQINDFESNQSPDDKWKKIESAKNQHKIVAMVGDGINDSLSLAAADVSISHTEAEDLSLEKSDVVLTSGNLNGITFAIESAALTRRVIKQNIIISLCYNSIMLPLAVFGFMLPVLCSVFMASSSLTVILNSLSIRYRRN
ncbi:putative P-type ATPase, copper transporting ATPase, a phophatase-like domain [Leptospira ryugenii]|uniref:Putative P-type ATPase, copper transporting ATPase, a phophatase-like domain n=1 Tax=Leptospira ryugenii TaxID=1917863 RepID=A0A2P2E4S3_9LEPT|nr:heavy metal translocating P-type ATPase [Leptospira ryugenii]GBF51877.1 putative P-type ATPase, copper transporting ATPase, a phophatase-like domain [Leptospira ryugenii]